MTPTFEIGPLELRYAHPFGLSRWTTKTTTNVLLRMEMDGHVGWGEGAPNRRYGETSDQDILFLEKWAPGVFEDGDPLAGLISLFEQTHVPGSAAAALDMAIHDWLGHRDGQPVYSVLGFPAPAPRATSFTIGIDEPGVVAAKTREAAGYEVLKIKVGTEQDEALIRAVRSASSKPLRVDANEGWRDRDTAARKVEWLAGEGVELVEQPFPAGRLDDVAWLRERSSRRSL
jgi:L-Ala-D/L-Glu epimerase